MLVSDAIIKCLELEDVEVIFGYPGGAVVPIYESLRKSKIKHILVRHEQSAAHGASGYSRALRKVGVCMATSGPGATNLITGIATAHMDSIPLVVITGQVCSFDIGKDVFQEADIIGATESFTKHSYLVEDAQDIPRIIKEAFYIAKTGRPGPVLIDIPLDIQKESIKFSYSNEIDIRGYKPTYIGHTGQIKRAYKNIKQSKRPIICAGGGIISSNANKELKEFSIKTGIPIVNTMMGIGSISKEFPLYCGMLGSHGNKYANKILEESDLIIVIGARIGDRATLGFKLISSQKEIIHIDIDPAEVGKNVNTILPVIGDAKIILNSMIELCDKMELKDWYKEIDQIKRELNLENLEVDTHLVNPKEALEELSKYAKADAIFTADVGRNQIWAARNITISEERAFFTSGGLGTMGYSIPAAIGAKIGAKEKQVISILGDGSFQMSMGELASIAENNANIKIILFNNSCLGMVRELQDINTNGKYFGIEFSKNPDFTKIAQAYGIKTAKVNNQQEFSRELKNMLNDDDAFILECIVDPNISSMI